jgi:hypothetical protein
VPFATAVCLLRFVHGPELAAVRKRVPCFCLTEWGRAQVSGPGDYYSDEEEEYPYREDSGSECEGEGEGEDEAGGDFEGETEGDQFEDEEAPGFKAGIWRRTDDDVKSEYTSWSKRTASSYLPPERRMQLWRDIEDFGLPDDGYDYTNHLRNPGAGVRLDANFSDDIIKLLEKKERMELAQADKNTRHVLAALDSDDEEAPPLEDETALRSWVEAGKDKLAAGEVVEEGELDDDFLQKLNDSEDEEAVDPLLSQPRDLRLLDEQFNAFLSAYDDDKIGELSEDVGPARPIGAPQEDEAYYRELLQSYINGTALPPGVKPVGRLGGEDEEYEEFEEDATPAGFQPINNDFNEDELKDITEKTKALGLAACHASDGETDDGDLEEVELEGKVQWDCESIVSTYSNIYNHPKQIADSRKAIKILINKSTGLPELQDAEGAPDKERSKQRRELPAGLTSQAEEGGSSDGSDGDDQGTSVCPSTRLFELGARKKDESAEDKKARKEAAKEVLSSRPIADLSAMAPWWCHCLCLVGAQVSMLRHGAVARCAFL